eukprot:ctg_1631.g501
MISSHGEPHVDNQDARLFGGATRSTRSWIVWPSAACTSSGACTDRGVHPAQRQRVAGRGGRQAVPHDHGADLLRVSGDGGGARAAALPRRPGEHDTLRHLEPESAEQGGVAALPAAGGGGAGLPGGHSGESLRLAGQSGAGRLGGRGRLLLRPGRRRPAPQPWRQWRYWRRARIQGAQPQNRAHQGGQGDRAQPHGRARGAAAVHGGPADEPRRDALQHGHRQLAGGPHPRRVAHALRQSGRAQVQLLLPHAGGGGVSSILPRQAGAPLRRRPERRVRRGRGARRPRAPTRRPYARAQARRETAGQIPRHQRPAGRLPGGRRPAHRQGARGAPAVPEPPRGEMYVARGGWD